MEPGQQHFMCSHDATRAASPDRMEPYICNYESRLPEPQSVEREASPVERHHQPRGQVGERLLLSVKIVAAHADIRDTQRSFC